MSDIFEDYSKEFEADKMTNEGKINNKDKD